MEDGGGGDLPDRNNDNWDRLATTKLLFPTIKASSSPAAKKNVFISSPLPPPPQILSDPDDLISVPTT